MSVAHPTRQNCNPAALRTITTLCAATIILCSDNAPGITVSMLPCDLPVRRKGQVPRELLLKWRRLRKNAARIDFYH